MLNMNKFYHSASSHTSGRIVIIERIENIRVQYAVLDHIDQNTYRKLWDSDMELSEFSRKTIEAGDSTNIKVISTLE